MCAACSKGVPEHPAITLLFKENYVLLLVNLKVYKGTEQG